ncbi:MAG: carboxylesterase family protein [Planctomycetes bacterium]|nr:carboxylesterase family protein [Planctomycetota bacterium]
MRNMIWAMFIFLAAGWTVAYGQSQPAGDKAETNIIKLDSGQISGTLVGKDKDVAVFKGIPFAAPPVGDLRWKPPQPAKPWEGVRKCGRFGNICPQPNKMAALVPSDGQPQNEDCLYLNVWAPANAPAGKGKLPVMVWIHGGGCTTGSGSSKSYDGENFARSGVVLVTINYRLGALGYLAHPLLNKESDKGVSGNYGMLDQIAALEWVKRNISAFGGDPDCVTIFGESAGGLSVCRLMVSPNAKGLFHRAIAESGGAHGRNRLLKQDQGKLLSGENVGLQLARDLGCDGKEDVLAAMRAKSADEILTAQNAAVGIFAKGVQWGPIVDGCVMPEDPVAVFEAGRQNKVPFMAGSNADEGTLFMGNLQIKGLIGYKVLMKLAFGQNADEMMKLFPAATDEEAYNAICKSTGVASFIMPARFLVRSVSQSGQKAWLYHFTRVPDLAAYKKLGCFHSLEVVYVFNNYSSALKATDVDRELCKAMMGAWIQFAKTGDPNREGLPAWPTYDAKTDQHLEFGDKIEAKSGLYKEACDLVEKNQASTGQ